MAEGDMVLRTARRLDDALAGRVVSVRCPSPRGRASGAERLDGRTVEHVESRGKHLLLRFDEGLVLHSHLGMSGSWQLYARGSRWRRPARQAWVALATEGQEAVQFGGSTLHLLPARRLATDPTLARLGPDILAPSFEVGDGVEALRRAPAGMQIGEALLEQRLLAGVGNIFKSEGCFAAAVSPWRRIEELSDEELTAVVAATRKLMADAVATGRQPKAVYRRTGGPCPRCGTALRSHGQGDANRTTYWCPACQA